MPLPSNPNIPPSLSTKTNAHHNNNNNISNITQPRQTTSASTIPASAPNLNRNPSRLPPMTSDGWLDLYAILNLDHWATTEEIKAQFRSLRSSYFSTDVTKYRQLQGAYEVLVDWDLRQKYDTEHRRRLGLPPPTPRTARAPRRPAPPSRPVSYAETWMSGATSPVPSSARSSVVLTDGFGGGYESPASSTATSPRNSVRDAIWRLDAQAKQEAQHRQQQIRLQQLEAQQQREEDQRQREEDEQRQREEEQRQREEEAERQRIAEEQQRVADPNYGLKRFGAPSPQKPKIGTRRYTSYVPIASSYQQPEVKKAHRRNPSYLGRIAKLARP